MKKWLAILLLLGAVLDAPAQTPGNGKTWRYLLLDGAAIMDDCTECDRLTFWEPLVGTFDLKGTAAPEIFEIQNIVFSSRITGYSVRGSGTLSLASGDPEIIVDLAVQRGDFVESVHMTNVVITPRIFPMIAVEGSAPPAPGHYYRLRIFAAPIRELWFSTILDFKRGSPGIPEESTITGGDLLSHTGRIVKRNAELAERLSIPPENIGLDAMDIAPRGEVMFSSVSDVESIVNGPIGDGDIITSAGRLYRENSQLLSPFGVSDPDAGLDALHYVSDDELYFSTWKEVTRASGGKLSRGDILSSKGRVVRTEANLMLRFFDPLPFSFGVDALYFWPNGELWFSTQEGFTNATISAWAGDIVSDQGYVALRHLEITAAFQPIATFVDVGLDAFTIVSDAAASAAAVQFTSIEVTPDGVDLRWEGSARVFQLERASNVEGPYTAVTPIILERSVRDPSVGTTAFYRVRQW